MSLTGGCLLKKIVETPTTSEIPLKDLENQQGVQQLRSEQQIPKREVLERLLKRDLEQLALEHIGGFSQVTMKQHEFMKEALYLVYQEYEKTKPD